MHNRRRIGRKRDQCQNLSTAGHLRLGSMSILAPHGGYSLSPALRINSETRYRHCRTSLQDFGGCAFSQRTRSVSNSTGRTLAPVGKHQTKLETQLYQFLARTCQGSRPHGGTSGATEKCNTIIREGYKYAGRRGGRGAGSVSGGPCQNHTTI